MNQMNQKINNFLQTAKMDVADDKSKKRQDDGVSPFLMLEEGQNYVAILPTSVDGEKLNWCVEIVTHYLGTHIKYVCPARTKHLHGNCKLCELARQAYAKKYDELGSKLYGKKRYAAAAIKFLNLANVVFSTPRVLDFGTKIKDPIEIYIDSDDELGGNKLFKQDAKGLQSRLLNISKKMEQGYPSYYVTLEDKWVTIPAQYLEAPLKVMDYYNVPSENTLDQVAEDIVNEAYSNGFDLSMGAGSFLFNKSGGDATSSPSTRNQKAANSNDMGSYENDPKIPF